MSDRRRIIGAYRDSKNRLRPITARTSGSTRGVPARLKGGRSRIRETKYLETSPDESITIGGVTKTRREWLDLETDEGPGTFKNTEEINRYRQAIKKHQASTDRYTHTSGTIIVDKDTVLKPVTGIKEYDDWRGKHKKFEFKTHEYEAIKALEDLPNIPHDTILVTVDGFDYIKRRNYHVIDDFRNLNYEQIIELEKTMREANKRGWSYGDTPQIALDKKTYKPMWYDWSTATDEKIHGMPHLANDNVAITTLWEKAGYETEIKDRNVSESLRIDYVMGVEHEGHKGIYRLEDEPYVNYGYLSYNRPPNKSWMRLLPKDAVITYIKPEEGWRVQGQIYTVNPLPDHVIKSYELVPTKHFFTDSEATQT